MAEIGLALANLAVGLGVIGAGAGFTVAEQNKMDDLKEKGDKLAKDTNAASDMYDHIYYLVAVNLACEEVLRQTSEPVELDPFKNVPLNDETPPIVPEEESSFSNTPKLDRTIIGLNVAGLVFGLGGLAATVGLGFWTLHKLNQAIDDIEKKQNQVTAFQTAMENALDSIVTAAGLPAKNYSGLTSMAATWKKISENFDSWEKAMYYAIRGYFMNKSLADIKTMVDKESDGKPFPDDAYPLGKTLADDIHY